jgi:hypothetical protein
MTKWFGLLIALTAACGDNTDGDAVAPAVLLSTPTAGATGVAPTSAIGVAFTERVRTDAGTVSIGGAPVDVATLAWDDGHQRFTVTPAMPFRAEEVVEVIVDGFVDEAGNPMAAEHRFSFSIAAPVERPRVVSITPTDGAQAVGVALDAIAVTFDRPMDPASGAATLIGTGVLAGVEWTSPTQARIPVSGLRGETPYIVALDAFRDVDGLPLDPEPVLGNGRLEFHTGLDDVAPEVVSSVPAEGATNVEVGELRKIEVVFAEPMRTSSGTAILSGLGDPVELAVTWSEDAHRATLVLPDAASLIYETGYTLELSGFMDVHGNALAAEPYLVNGCLDFAAGADTMRPRFLSSTITDGAMGVATADPRNFQYDILFEVSELVDVSNATATIEVDGESFDNVYVYAAGHGRTVQVSAVGAARPLRYDATYAVKLVGVTDLAGNEIDPAGYLGDGQLDFTTGPDTIAPFVAQLTGLVEGSGSLSPWGNYVHVTFSEPIDGAAAAIELVHFGSSGTTVLDPPMLEWFSDTELMINFPSTGLTSDQRYGLRFVGFVDLQGNALDPVPLLGDGTLDFSVGAARPLRSTPTPGVADVYPYELYRSDDPAFGGIRQRSKFELQFTEPMDTSIDTVQLVDETDPSAPSTQTVQVTWSQDGTTLSFVLAEALGYEPLQGGRQYALRFANLRGADGLAVDAGATHYSGARLRFRTQPTNPQLDHTCIHLLYDPCEQVDAYATSVAWAPTTDQSHSYFEVSLPPAAEGGGYLGYTTVNGDDETDLLMYLREPMSVSIRDIDAAFDVPLVSVAAPPACAVVTGAPGCGAAGEVGVTRIVRARMPLNGTYVARWASEHEVVHFVTERAGAF